MAHVEKNGGARSWVAQAMQPGTQQWRGFHPVGKDAARRANEGVKTQFADPGTQTCRAKRLQQRANLGRTLAETRQEQRLRLRMREVQPTPPSQQELASDRGHRVVQMHRHAGSTEHLGCHQSSRTATNHGHCFHLRPVDLSANRGTAIRAHRPCRA